MNAPTLNTAALSKLRDYLLTINDTEGRVTYGIVPVEFDLGTWFGKGGREESPCGFAACAIGHGILAGIIPGIIISEISRSHPKRYTLDIHGPADLASADESALFALRDAADGVRSGEYIARTFLGMTEEQFKFCFYIAPYETSYPTPAMVAKHIDIVLEDAG